MSAEFLLTSSLEPIKKGQQFEGALPLHLTIQQWFTLEYERAFQNALQNYVGTVSPFEVIGDEEALFGPENNVSVRRVRNVGKLAIVHAKTKELLEQFGGELLRPEWAGAGYNPHVTYVGDRGIGENEPVLLKTIELIKRDEGSALKTAELVLSLRGEAK